jgi:hypothetical protein
MSLKLYTNIFSSFPNTCHIPKANYFSGDIEDDTGSSKVTAIIRVLFDKFSYTIIDKPYASNMF